MYPAEVESVLYAHPAIAEVAVIGLPDDRWGETVTAIVVANDKLPTLEELRDFAGVELAPYKLPRQLHVVDALPRNLAGRSSSSSYVRGSQHGHRDAPRDCQELGVSGGI